MEKPKAQPIAGLLLTALAVLLIVGVAIVPQLNL